MMRVTEQNTDRLKTILAVSEHLQNIAEGTGPIKDYEVISAEMDARVIGCTRANWMRHPFAVAERAFALDLSQAARILRDFPTAKAYISFSERTGIPLAALLRSRHTRPAHVMIAHRLNTRSKRLFRQISQWHNGIDTIVTMCSTQLEYARQLLPDSSVFIRQGIDTDFYSPQYGAYEGNYILSVGSESRDYATLAQAAEIFPYPIKILASSPWSRNRVRNDSQSLPTNMEFLPRLDYDSVRKLYREAKVIVVPLHDTYYAAGVNAVLEGFAVGKPVLVSGSLGILDYVCHSNNAYVVPVANAEALADAVELLWNDSALREALGEEARRWVVCHCGLVTYAAAISQIVKNNLK